MYKGADYIYEAISSLAESAKVAIDFYSNVGDYDGTVEIDKFCMLAKKDERLIHANIIVNEIVNESREVDFKIAQYVIMQKVMISFIFFGFSIRRSKFSFS